MSAVRTSGVRLDAQLLREQRLLLGFTQDALAHRAGVATRTVKTAEAGHGISALSAVCITKALELPYAAAVRVSAEVVEKRLHLSGYAPLKHKGVWVGRESDISRLGAELRTSSGGWCLMGPSGIGKSALMRRLAADVHEEFPDGIIWVQGHALGDSQARLAVQRDIAEALAFETLLPRADRVSAEAVDDAFATRLFSSRRLLIIDDLESLADAMPFVPGHGAWWIAATTAQRQEPVPPDWNIVAVSALDHHSSRTLLAAIVDDARLNRDPEAADAVLALCAGVPAHLEIAGQLLARNRHLEVAEVAGNLHGGAGEGARLAHWRRHLSPKTLAGLASLRIFGTATFSKRWAAVACGFDDTETRALLNELERSFVLDEVPPPEELPGLETRYRLAGHAFELGGPHGSVDEAQLGRCLPLVPRWADASVLEHVSELQVDLSQWRLMYDRAAREVADLNGERTRSGLDDLPLASGSVTASARALLRDPLLHVLVRFLGPHQSPGWVVAAMAMARSQDDHANLGSLAALYGWWWFARRGDLRATTDWTRIAWQSFQRSGDAEGIIQYGCHHAIFAWIAEGHVAAATIRESALLVARRGPLRWEPMVSVLVSTASSRALLGRPESARALLVEAREIVPEGTDKYVTMARAVIGLNIAVCDALMGVARADDTLVEGWLHDVYELMLKNFPITVYRLGALAECLGVRPPCTPLSALDAVLSVPQHFAGDQLAKLVQLCAEMRVPMPQVTGGGAAVATAIGPLSRLGIIMAHGASPRPELHFDVLSPVRAMRTLLEGDRARLVLDFVERMADPQHVLRQVLRELVAAGGLPPD